MSTSPTTNEHTEVAVIGAGQAGLAVGVALQQRGIDPLILEAAPRVGDSWRARWDSLRLYNPASGASLPGLPFPGAGDRFPTGREVADYLETYAATMGLTVRTDTAVRALRAAGDGGYTLETDLGTITADAVVITTGAYRTPFVPELATRLDAAIRQIHSSDYRRPDQLADGPVLVVGASHSGADLALEAALAGHETHLSGAIHGQLPFPIDSRRGRLAWPVLRFAWTRVLTIRTPMGRRMKARVRHGGAPLLRVRLAELTDAGVMHHPARTVDVSDGRPMLDDGTVLGVNTVVWCTGFRPDYAWVHLDRPFAAADGWPAERNGATDWPGLFVSGIPFQTGFASMLLLGAGPDGARVADGVARHIARRESAAAVRTAGVPG